VGWRSRWPVYVTLSPDTEGLLEELSAVVVLPLLTVCVRFGEVLVLKLGVAAVDAADGVGPGAGIGHGASGRTRQPTPLAPRSRRW